MNISQGQSHGLPHRTTTIMLISYIIGAKPNGMDLEQTLTAGTR
jgi:hypothetical protein